MIHSTDGSTESSTGTWRTASYLVIAWFPFFVVFVLIPFAVYFPNQQEFGNNLIFPLVSASVAAALFVATIPLMLLRPTVRARLASALFFVGVYIALADILAPVGVGDLTAGPEHVKPFEPPFLTIVEILILSASIGAAVWFRPSRVAQIGAPSVLALVVIQAVVFASNIPHAAMIRWGDLTLYERKAFASDAEEAAGTGNIYHICIDAYSSLVFLETLSELDNPHAFDGFTFFENNRSNYVFTRGSFPSFMTGEFFKGGSTEKWRKERYNGGMIKTLHQQGYTISVYAPFPSYSHKFASVSRQTLDIVEDGDEPEYVFRPQDFVDLCLMRIAPNWLAQELYAGGVGLVRRLFPPRAVGSGSSTDRTRSCRSDIAECLPLMRGLIRDEEARPDHGQYVYVHLWVTHNPIGTRNQDCSCNTSNDSSYFDHAVCATSVVVRFIEELKRLEKFKDATIIIQSDHGHPQVGPEQRRMPPLTEEIASRLYAVSQIDPLIILNKTYALLLVKPPGRYDTPLRISRSPTVLVDIPTTVYSLLGIDKKTEQGESIFSLEESQAREIHMFAGFVQGGGDSMLSSHRTPLEKGELCHFSYTNGKGWRLHPDIPFTRD